MDPQVGAVVGVGGSDLSTVAVVLLVVVSVVIARAWREAISRRHPRRRGSSSPDRFSYWYALVPFEDGTGSKERPVLVLSHDGRSAKVLKVTSKAKPGRTDYRRLDTSRWDRPGAADGSWLQTGKVVIIPLAGFRRHLGDETNTMFTRELVRIHPAAVR